MNDLQDILTDIADLIRRIAYKIDDIDDFNLAKDLFDKILEYFE